MPTTAAMCSLIGSGWLLWVLRNSADGALSWTEELSERSTIILWEGAGVSWLGVTLAAWCWSSRDGLLEHIDGIIARCCLLWLLASGCGCALAAGAFDQLFGESFDGATFAAPAIGLSAMGWCYELARCCSGGWLRILAVAGVAVLTLTIVEFACSISDLRSAGHVIPDLCLPWAQPSNSSTGE